MKFNKAKASEQYFTMKQFQTNLWDPVLVSVKFCASSRKKRNHALIIPKPRETKTFTTFEYISAFSAPTLHRYIVRFRVAERRSHSSSGRSAALFKIPKYKAVWVSEFGILAAPTPTLPSYRHTSA
jgi:hypothetical protein